MRKITILIPILFLLISCDKKQETLTSENSDATENTEIVNNPEIAELEDENADEIILTGNEANYTEFLTNALSAAKNKNQSGFINNMKYFSTAIEEDKITPESLSDKNRNLYTKCLYEALINQLEIPDNFARQAIVFLNYKSDSHPENIFSLGRLYDYGWGVNKDLNKAAELYTQAAEKGHARAMYNIGNMYMKGDGVTKDYSKAKYWYEKGAEKGDDASLQGMALLYHNGWGVSKDLNKAADWYIKAANKGNENAIRNMSSLDSEKAFNWYKSNEKKGGKDIYYSLGRMLQYGLGTEVNKVKAHTYFMKAAKLGNAAAQYMVGYNYDEGYGGVQINWKEAVKWYQKAANQNHSGAAYGLGEFYYFGVGGVKQDINKAIDYFKKANKGKIINAETALKVIEDIKNGAYYSHQESKSGNTIYLEESDMKNFYKKMPVTMTEFGASWKFPVHFYNNSNGNLKIWPTQFSQDSPDDYVNYSNYSSSPGFSAGAGQHEVGISHKKEWGNRAIGYVYISGHFPNEELIIKVPVAVCWKPQNEY